MIRSRMLGIGPALALALALGGITGAEGVPTPKVAANAAADVQRVAVFEIFGRDT